MRTQDWARLLALAAIWGGSFVFTRIVAPALGPFRTADFRILLAGSVIVAYLRLTGFRIGWSESWRKYLVIGVLGSAFPFTLFSFAGRHIPASYSVILNATAPLFGAVFAALWLSERLTGRKLLGMVLGSLGVALVAGAGSSQGGYDAFFWPSIGACLLASVSYALTGIYMKKRGAGLKPTAIAGASQLLGGIALAPIAAASPVPGALTPGVLAAACALSLLCSAVAYLIYYRLMDDVGPSRALTVTFLMPVFGVVWGALFLGERLTGAMLLGCSLVVSGTVLTVVAPASGAASLGARLRSGLASRWSALGFGRS